MEGIRSRSPSPNPNGRTAPALNSSSRPRRSASPAPALPPAPPLRRLLSTETIDRSNHNAFDNDDGSGLSKDEIIAELKKANAALTTKTAEMEATFMNQCNVLAAEVSEQASALKVKNGEISLLNARSVAAEDTALSTLDNESSFQKQTITDLKNQLFQLQQEVEDAEFDKSEAVAIHNRRTSEAERKVAELEREHSALVHKVDVTCMERDQVKIELATVKTQMEELDMNSIEINLSRGEDDFVKKGSANRSFSGESVASEVRQNWKQLQDVQEKLQASETLLHETQSALATLERKQKTTLKQFESMETQIHDIKSDGEKQIAELKSMLQSRDDTIGKHEATLTQFESMETQKSDGEKTIAQLKSMLRSRDDTIGNLHARLETYNEDLTKAEEEIDQLNVQIDAEEIRQMGADLEETSNLLEYERELTASLTEKYEALSLTVERLEEKTQELRDGSVADMISSKEERIASLEQELDVFRSSLSEEKKSTEMLMNLKGIRITELENELKMKTRQIVSAAKEAEEKSKEEALVQKLKDTVEELSNELEEKLSAKDSEIAKLSDAIDAQLRKIATMEEAYNEEIAKLNAEILMSNQAHREGVDAEMSDKETDLARLREEIEALEGAHEQELAETRQDIETREQDWGFERSQLWEKISSLEDEVATLAEIKNTLRQAQSEINTLKASQSVEVTELREELRRAREENEAQAINTLNASSSHSAEVTELQEELQRAREESRAQEINTWKASSSQSAEVTELREELQRAREESEAQKINTWKASSSQSAEVTELREELRRAREEIEAQEINTLAASSSQSAEVTELREELQRAREESEAQEINTWKASSSQSAEVTELREELRKAREESEAQKINTWKASSSQSAEVTELREELRKARGESEENSTSEKQSTAKRAYFFAMEKKHKKELTELEAQRRKEIAAMKNKLYDRDTTITATIKSSVAQEQKIENLQQMVEELQRETQAPNVVVARSSGTGNRFEVDELRRRVDDLLKTKSSMARQISSLKKHLSETMMDGEKIPDSPPRAVTKHLSEYKLKLQERDGAIATLVKSSITQEQQITVLREQVAELKARNNSRGGSSTLHGNGPSWQEFTRLQQESEMFAGQIIELDEEIEELRQRLMDERSRGDRGANLTFAVEELGNQVQEQKKKRTEELKRQETIVEGIKMELEEEQELRSELEAETKSLRAKLKKNSKLSRVQDELEAVEEANGKLQHEVREVRRKMRTAQLESEKVPDLESEISAMRESMNKLKIESVNRHADEVMGMKVQTDLQKAVEQRDAAEIELYKYQEQCTTLQDIIARCEEKEHDVRNEMRDLELIRNETEAKLKEQIDAERDCNARLSDAKDGAELKSRRIVESLKDKMKELETDIDEQNEIISALTDEVRKLRSSTVEDSDSDDIILALTDEVKKLRSKQISEQGGESDVIQALSHEVKTLHAALKQKEDGAEARNIEAMVRAEVEDELQSMKKQKDFLGKEVSRLQLALDSLENGDARIRDLKKQVEDAEKARTQFEKTMISTYERKLNLMQMNKDLTIDGLRKELSQLKERQKETEADLLNKIRILESDKNEIEAELLAKMQHKNAKINFLEQTLSAHEHVSGHMKDELDQLQSGMETVSVSRRAEVEEMQEDLMDARAKATRNEREITSLKMRIEEQRLQHRNEVSRLENAIDSLESNTDTPMMRDVTAELERRLENDYRLQLDRLLTKMNHVQDENVNLRHTIEKDGKLRASNTDKWRNSALQEKVIKLQQRLRELEGDGGSVRSSTSRRSSRTESSPRVPRSPADSFNKRDSGSRNGGRDDISTRTEMTF